MSRSSTQPRSIIYEWATILTEAGSRKPEVLSRKGEGFAIDTSIIKADASRFSAVPETQPVDWGQVAGQGHAVREYLRGLEDDEAVSQPAARSADRCQIHALVLVGVSGRAKIKDKGLRMQLAWLEDFVELARTRSFSRAAENRFITHPAFGRRIRALEEWVGTALVERKQPVSRTPAGKMFLDAAVHSLDVLHSACAQLQDIALHPDDSERRAARIRLPLGRWRSSGYGSSTAAGRPEHGTTKASTSTPSGSVVRHSSGTSNFQGNPFQ